jgi:hypothetical protein
MAQDKEIMEHLTHLTTTVTEVLSWLQAAESQGVVPKGTLRSVSKRSRTRHIQSKVSGVQEALALLEDSSDLDSLQRSLEDSIRKYQQEAGREET